MKRRTNLVLGAFSVLFLILVASEMIGLTNLHATANWPGDRYMPRTIADEALQKHRLFQLSKKEFPDWYERLLEEFVQETVDGVPVDQIATFMRRRFAKLNL